MATLEHTIAEIEFGYPPLEPHTLHLNIGACSLDIQPGAGEHWVQGEYEFPSDMPMPTVKQSGGDVTISQAHKGKNINLKNWKSPRFDLKLGQGKPYALDLNGGAFSGSLELGGIPLRTLDMDQGAGKLDVNFSTPNPTVMETLTVGAGAMAITMKNLANANFRQMSADCGASKLDLHFGGTLQADAEVKLTSGAGKIKLQFPRDLAARIVTDTTFTKISASEGIRQQDKVYSTPAAQRQDRPLLTIHAEISVGKLEIELI